MGYTVISQNNTTTTLQDENGNIVHVPAKTVLATSTEYEISEVNNSTATLTSSDGKVIRGIPCVAVLSGSEGGGGGAVSSVNGQTGDVVITGNDVLPDQTGNAGKFLTTDGTDAGWGTTINPITITPTALNYTGVVKLKGYNNNNDILYMNMTPSTGNFEIDIRNNTGTRTGWYYFDSAFYPNQTMSNLTLGKSTNKWANVYTAKINNGADITVPNQAGTMVVADSTSATAGQVLTLDSNLQPVWQAGGSGGGLPSQTGNAGKFLTTDGTDASWSDKPLVNTSESVSNSFTTQGAVPISQWGNSTAVGVGADANNIGTPVAGYNTAFGANAAATSASCSAFGSAARAVKMFSNAFGRGTYANGNGALALGALATVNANNAIQLNVSLSSQTNSDANTMKVANANGNFEMMSADGTIPAARHAALPAADGTYTLQLVITNGVPTLSWVAV